MPSLKFSRFFSQPEVFRGIDPDNLLSLLADHAAALGLLGLKLPDGADAAAIDYERLMALLMEPDKLPADLREAFYFIHEMATDEGMACLLEAAEDAGIEIVGEPGPTPGDVAVQVWLRDRELLERKHAEQFLQNARSFQSFGTDRSPVPKYRDPTPRLAQMKKELDDFFEKKKRGRNTKIFPYVREDSVWFLVRHGDPFKREGAIDDKGESYGAYYWPEKFDVLVLDPTDGELRINARNKGEKKKYREVFGRHLYNDEGFFSVENKYTLEPLREKGEDAIAPIEGMDEVLLIEVDFFWGGSFAEKEIRKADDVFGAYKARNRTFPTKPRIVKACFRVTFSDSDRPRTVTIKPPNEAQYTRDADSLIVEKWLKARGFIVKKGKAKHEPTAKTALVGT
ncbi:MAG TPA: hypothetical protein DCX07_09805 [Phycisphaerales bacterium]|nr:hypothetical protein [Phycisphaerales bacterium]